MDDVSVFLDTSVLFAAVESEGGGARAILKLGEAGVVALWIGPWVLREMEDVLERKSPGSKAYFALLLDRAGVRVGQEAGQAALERALSIVKRLGDAHIVAEALTVGVDYLASLDRKLLVGNPDAAKLPFAVGTPGDFLAWYRGRLLAAR